MDIFTTIALQEMLTVAFRTVFIFIYAFILLRLLGRRRLSHLTYVDVLLIIAYGSAVGDVMIYGEDIVHFVAAIVAITIVALLVKILDEFVSHSPRAQNLIEGQARLLINNGAIIQEALAKENMSKESLMTLLRERNIHSVGAINKAFIESDGELSIVLKRRNGNHSSKK